MPYAAKQRKCAPNTHKAKGYRMIESFEIENFRCFKKASLKNLRTINIIVGNNGSGKTALVEALAMAAFPTPLLATRIRMARNRPTPEQMAWNRSSFEAFWQDLFSDFDTSKKIGLQFTDSLKGSYKVEVYYDRTKAVQLLTLLGGSGYITPLIFNRINKSGKKETINVELDEKGGLKVEGNIEALPNFYAFPSTQPFYTTDIVNYFSNIKEKGEHGVILKAFQKDFPQIDDISILLDATVPSLFATIKEHPVGLAALGLAPRDRKHIKRSFPLTIISAGAVRYLNILLAIAATKNGIVVVDEIENGIYWQKMPNIWKTLRNFCHNNGVQLFATTHSYECLEALLPDMEDNVDDYSLIRTWENMDMHNIKQFNGKSMQATLKIHGEIR